MKLLFIIKALDDVKGGAERVLCVVASGLARRGHDVTVLSFDAPGGEAFYPLDEKVRRITLGIGDTHHKAKPGETLKRMKAIREVARREQPDVVAAFMHSAFVPAALALIGTGVPVIASEHIVPDHYKTRRFEFILFLLSSLFIRRITVLSDRIRRNYPHVLQRKMIAVANPVTFPDTLADAAGQAGERKTILNVGRLDPQKDQKILIRAFAALAGDYPDWDVRIVGEGPLRPDLEDLVQELGLRDRVFLPGATRNIGAQYAGVHIFALPSRYESFGLATAEAMAHGLPAVGFADCPGTNELIRDGENGWLASGSDRMQAFAAALEDLMRAPEKRVAMGRVGRESVARYAPDNILDAWEEILTI